MNDKIKIKIFMKVIDRLIVAKPLSFVLQRNEQILSQIRFLFEDADHFKCGHHSEIQKYFSIVLNDSFRIELLIDF